MKFPHQKLNDSASPWLVDSNSAYQAAQRRNRIRLQISMRMMKRGWRATAFHYYIAYTRGAASFDYGFHAYRENAVLTPTDYSMRLPTTPKQGYCGAYFHRRGNPVLEPLNHKER